MLICNPGKQMDILHSSIKRAHRSLRNKPEGCLQICKNKNVYQYFYRSSPSMKKGTYLHKDQRKLAIALAQKSYDLKFLAVAEKLEKDLLILKEGNDPFSDHDFYQVLLKPYYDLSPPRRELVTPYILPDEKFMEQWLSVNYSGLPFDPNMPEIYTELGERVRSKSEKLIADKLLMQGIPYRYEYPFFTKRLGLIHPDFTILDIWNRVVIIFEHFGRMEDSEYTLKNMNKIEAYSEEGLVLGRDFIFTMESKNHVINMQHFERLINNRLPRTKKIVFA